MTYWFVFCKSDLLIERNDDGTYGVPTGDTPPTDVKSWTTIHNITPFDDGSAVKTYSIDLPVTGHPRYEIIKAMFKEGVYYDFNYVLREDQYVHLFKNK